jgi:hypothetical protein
MFKIRLFIINLQLRLIQTSLEPINNNVHARMLELSLAG